MAADSMARRVQFRNSLLPILVLIFFGCETSPSKNCELDEFVLLNKTTHNTTWANGLLTINEKPFTGKLYTLHDASNDTAELSTYQQGKEHGEWKKFYPHRKLKDRRYFIDGKKSGEYIGWWENGKKQLHYYFVNDEYEGTCQEWNAEGTLVKVMNYKRGHEDGHQQWWYDNGKVKANYIIRNGRRYGLLGTKNCINVSDSVFNR